MAASINQIIDKSKTTNSEDINFSMKQVFINIRNFLAGSFVGATRDDVLLHEVVKLLFCKFHFEAEQAQMNLDQQNEIDTFYRSTFDKIKLSIPEIFKSNEEITLDASSIEFVHNQIKDVTLLDAQRDPIGDAYEIFIGNIVRGQEGQFFTPRNAINVLVTAIDPKPGEKILDPTCGAGGFLISTIQHFITKGYTKEEIIHGANNVMGVDKDEYLTSLAKIHIASLTSKTPKIVCADSILWDENIIGMNNKEQFDVILTNPPFGANIVAGTKETLAKYSLAYKWKLDKLLGYIKTKDLQVNVPPQVLFVEQCINLLKPNGRLGIVVPESLISSKKYGYVVEFIKTKCNITAVLGMPENLFKTSGKGGTHTKTCLLVLTKKASEDEKNKEVFFAEAKFCGHDSRGKQIWKDDLPAISANLQLFKEASLNEHSNLGYTIEYDGIENNILAPRYYDPHVFKDLEKLKKTHDLLKIDDLITDGTLRFSTGDEVGKLAYGTGDIPFVRTSDISTWEIKVDPKHGVNEELYNSIKKKQDVQTGDLLMVRDGTYLIGTTAMVTEYDERIVYQSHLLKIRVNLDNPHGIDPYLLLAILSSDFVQTQIKTKCFTQDIIDSLGDRYKDLIIPVSKDENRRKYISEMVSKAIFDRIEARELSRKARIEVLL